MKRRHRKPVLDINGDSDSPRRLYEYTRNGSPSNPLSTLVGQYNSDSEEDARPRSHALNDQVDDFLKEIQSIAPENSNKNNPNSSMQHPGSYWQECYDEQTGYPYYWHMETNQVTWEIPPELKMLQGKDQPEMGAPSQSSHSSHIPPWSSNKYSSPQSNIPDGMIPKEVVARNRNRQAGILNAPVKPPSKPAKSPGYKKEDDVDGKIEMITSFGNESESEESEPEEPAKKLPVSILKKPPKPPKSSTSYESSSSKSSNSNEPKAPVGPALPPISPMNYGPQNKQSPSTSTLTLSEKLSQTSKRTNVIYNSEEDILTRLKNQAKLFQTSKNASSNDSTKNSDSNGKKLKLSLVPGYEDDSDGGEDEASPRKVGKPLFPISQTISSSDTSNKVATKSLETASGQFRIYDYRNTEPPSTATSNATSSEDKNEELYGSNENSCDGRVEDSKTEQEAKANKFLESIDAPTKAFQRKRRIAFDVAPTKTKAAEPTKEDSPPSQPSEHRGFGYSKEEAADSPKPDAKTDTETTQSTTKPRPAMIFVKTAEDDSNGSNSNSSSKEKTKEITEAEKAEMRALTDPIMEKLKFLSEGSPAASAVQIMAIQIQTLMAAWESGSLQESYLRNWLVGTGCELTRLEKAAAPPGWECQWDRSHKRYYYRNASTGDAQWTYPEADIVGGTEEMELCTTPPPPEHEEAPIIEMSATTATLCMGSSTPDTVKAAESATEKSTNSIQPPMPEADAPPPPPPIISSPSPPPPPRIFAEDLKRGQKRKNSPEASDSKSNDASKESKSSSPAVTEPLPPGVDPPELAYTLSASALDPSVLYTAQQTNPIYAATLASAAAGIPLLSHHPAHHHPHHAAAAAAALMPGQLMHYNQAYHQHLHNQALVAARLQGQEAVHSFMVAAEYARAYENNQIAIAKPPVKVAHDASLGSAINSFYSDIASIEKSSIAAIAAAAQPSLAADLIDKERQMLLAGEMIAAPTAPSLLGDDGGDVGREKKKKKTILKAGLGKKQKEMSSMVAKWQRAQQNYKD